MPHTLEHYANALTEPFSLPEDLPDLSKVASTGPTILIFAPHPDDECIIGLLPLLWKRQLGARVINVAVTLGSNRERQKEREAELRKACAVLGFELHTLGFENVTPDTRANKAELWQSWVSQISDLISEHQADALVFPHAQDHHPAHIGTHHLVMDAFDTLPASARPHRLLTEFWQAMQNPNLMVESSQENLALLLKALACHTGEISRNPYHLRLPAWMIDNTRRGAELIGGSGAHAPNIAFSTLYRWLPSPAKQDLLKDLDAQTICTPS